MANRLRTLVAAGGIALATACSGAAALTADEVLVVGNAASAESAALARSYAERRNIDAGQVVLIRAPLGMDISRDDYEGQVRRPLRQALTDRKLKDRIRCICLVWGVPVRVGGLKDAPEEQARAAVQSDAEKMHYRLVIDYNLLDTVGRDFPEPRTDGLKPLGALFASPVPAPSKPLPKVDQVKQDVQRLFAAKQAQVAAIADPARRKLASRQLQALHLDLGGLQGLIDHVREARPADAPNVEDLQKQLAEAQGRLAALRSARAGPESLRQVVDLIEQTGGILTALSYADKLADQLRKVGQLVKSEAAVDSELACLWWDDYTLRGAAPNPLHWRHRGGGAGGPTLMTARIDGPTPADAMRIVKASLAAEAEGLKGVLYVDAGGPDRVAAAARDECDSRLKDLARFVRDHAALKVVLDEKPTVFPQDSCPHAAVYVGWYSLQKYVPAFMWKPGAVGWHIASWEAVHLRDPASQEWCVKMIQNGVAATLGAVSEPLLTAFPEPDKFFPLLLTGKYTVAECYWRTIPSVSWQMTLIADPLYNPFRADPQVKPADLPAGLAP